MFIVLGSIIFGIATPSEAAGIGALGAIILAYSQNNLSKIILDKCVFESIKLTSMVFMILIGAILFSLVFRGLEGEEFIHKFLIEMPDNKFMTLFIVLLIMFFLGFILDFIEIIFINLRTSYQCKPPGSGVPVAGIILESNASTSKVI